MPTPQPSSMTRSAARVRLTAAVRQLCPDASATRGSGGAAAQPAATDGAPTARAVGLLGLPSDINSTYMRGPAGAPADIRWALACDSSNPYSEAGDAFPEATDDCGDVELDAGLSAAEADAAIELAVGALLAAGRRPLLLGGDHSVSYPAFRAVSSLSGRASLPAAVRGWPIVIVHFDAHPDLYPDVSTFMPEVRKTPCRPRSWANFSLLQLYSHRNVWANLRLLGQPNTFLAAGERQIDIVYL